jgi:polyhydroxyalkanoate depolymerase
MIHKLKQAHQFPEVGIPIFWPLGIALKMQEQAIKVESNNLKYLTEIVKTQVKKEKPQWATANKELYTLHTFTLRDFSNTTSPKGIPVLLIPPYAGHTSVIADFQKHQSLVATLLDLGVENIKLTDWHSATLAMKDYDIDQYLTELNIAIDDLGGKVHLIGLCQGGWMAALYAARFPNKVASLVLAGSPIDTQAGHGVIKEFANTLPFSFYQELVDAGGGLMRGAFMVEGFKNMHPEKQYIEKYAELYEHINDADYVKRTENFERWYEYTIDLPGRWYLQVVKELFMEDRFVKGQFVGLGQKLDPKAITCPTYLLAGRQDDITPQEQVFQAERYFGTPKDQIVKDLAAGGHIGLFMGTTALSQNWPKIAAWLMRSSKRNVDATFTS